MIAVAVLARQGDEYGETVEEFERRAKPLALELWRPRPLYCE